MTFMTSEFAWQKAAACAKKAADSFDDEAAEMFERLRDRWISLAQKFELEDSGDASSDGEI